MSNMSHHGNLKEVEKKFHFDGNKLIYHMDRVDEHFKWGHKIYPLHIDIGATKMCNAKCVYCYGIHQKMSYDIIPRDSLMNVFSQAPELGIRSITVTGDGEPTLNPAIYEALTIGKLKGLDLSFATNGIALDEKKIETLLRTCTWLRFNVSAVSASAYKSVHGVDQWDRVQANIRLATKIKKAKGLNCAIGLQMVLIPMCIDHVVLEAEFAVEAGVEYFVIKQFSDPGCAEMSQFDLKWYDNDEVARILKKAQDLSTKRTKIIPKWGMIKSKGIRPYDHCVDCALIFQISGSSKCYPCGYLFTNDDYCYGDLKKQTLKEILDSERYWRIVKHMRESFDVHKECSGCCRHDFTNKFIWDYLHPPEHINFI